MVAKMIDRHERTGHPLDPDFLDYPELEGRHVFLMNAFNELSTERQFGQVVGPIPISKAREYGQRELDLEGDDLDDFVEVMTRVDADYLSQTNKPPVDPKMKDVTPASDAKGQSNLLKRLARKPGQISHVKQRNKREPL